MTDHVYIYPKATEIIQPREPLDHDPFIDEFATEALAKVIQLRPNNVIKVDFENGKRA